jgi:hypothetical protein
MGWTSVVRQPIQKLIRITDNENKNLSSMLIVLLITAAD